MLVLSRMADISLSQLCISKRERHQLCNAMEAKRDAQALLYGVRPPIFRSP